MKLVIQRVLNAKCEVDNKDKTLVISFTNNKEKDKFLNNITKK